MRLVVISAFQLFSISAFTHAAPVLEQIQPRGGQRGTAVEAHFYGERLEAGAEALCYEPGLSLSPLELKDPKHAVATLTIAADAPLGEHSIRLRSPSGITELRSFWVGQFPSVAEIEPNNSFDQAQRIELNSTVHGIAGSEDEDTYLCTLKKGQRLAVEVEAMRLGRVMFDASIAILGPNRFELATCDDRPLLRTDACAAIIAPEDGDYRIVVREAAYEGTDQCQYRLHIGTFPRPTAVFPTGGKPGQAVEFTFFGDPAGPITQSIELPTTGLELFPLFPQQDGLFAPSPHRIVLSPLEAVREVSPNGDVKSATPMPAIPSAAHGILDGTQARDWFQFNAKKGEILVLQVLARSLRSPLDSILTVTDSSGKALASNDDQGGPDSQLTWTAPADASYGLEIRDQLGRTGPDFTYRIEIRPRIAGLAATLPTVERVNTQKWKTFAVPRGNRYAAVVNLARLNTNCDAVFEAVSLPPGVTLSSPPISKAMTSFPIVLEAAADAPIGGGLMRFFVKSTGLDPALSGPLTDTIHHIDINNQGPYHSVTLDRIATAACAEVPFKIDLLPAAVPIVKNGTLTLTVRATRAAGYNEKITVRFLWNPPGVSGPVTVEIPGDQSEIGYELNASADAAVGNWSVCVLAEANSPQGPVLVSSALTPLEVAEPYLTLALDLAATEQGRATPILGKIALLKDFAGQATAELMGLPHGAKTSPQSFTKDQTEITFPVEIAADAAVGKHTSLFCRINVPANGAAVSHQTGQGGTLRIDAPARAPAPAPVAAAAPAKPEPNQPAPPPATQKPLSRLEQLRAKMGSVPAN